MSFSYCRVIPEPVFNRMYGFENVNAKQMHSITRRLQKPTYSTGFYHKQCFQTQTSPPCPPPVTCKRAQAAGASLHPQQEASFSSQRDLERAIRRVCTPTLSRMAAEGKIAPSYETNFQQNSTPPQSKTVMEQSKVLQRIRRPTTASTNKDRDSREEYFKIVYSGDPAVTADDIQTILDRVCTPTIASEGGIGPTCPKRRDSVGKNGYKCHAKQMPLISGLERSKSVSEIVNRLYNPPEASVMNGRPKNTESKLQRPKSCKTRRPSSSISRKSTLSSVSEPAPNFSIHISNRHGSKCRETKWGYSEYEQNVQRDDFEQTASSENLQSSDANVSVR